MTEEEHLLQCVAEECGEVAGRVSKALRFGLTEVQPGQEGQPLNNAGRVAQEMVDLRTVYDMATAAGLLPPVGAPLTATSAVLAKRAKVLRFMDHAREHGAITGPRTITGSYAYNGLDTRKG